MAAEEGFTFRIQQEDTGKRFDAVVGDTIAGLSRSFAASLIRDGHIRVEGQLKKPSYKVKQGETITGTVPPPLPLAVMPEPILIRIVYEDEDIVVVNKPAGIVVHPGAGNRSGTLVNALLFHCPDLKGIGGVERPGIVHRLDKNTSGLMVVAKTHAAHQALSLMFKNRDIHKEYVAIVHGAPKEDAGVITCPVGRHPTERKKMSTQSRSGRHAETLWRVVERFRRYALLSCIIKTGRTHQIRVHLASIHHPVVGDAVYGTPHRKYQEKEAEAFYRSHVKPLSRHLLHARRLSFPHPVSGKRIDLESPIPEEMERFIQHATCSDGSFSTGKGISNGPLLNPSYKTI